MTAAYLAAWANKDQALRILIHHAANIDTPAHTCDISLNISPLMCDCSGDTPLMVAATYGHAASVEVLIEAGADATPVNRDGLNALELACKVVS